MLVKGGGDIFLHKEDAGQEAAQNERGERERLSMDAERLRPLQPEGKRYEVHIGHAMLEPARGKRGCGQDHNCDPISIALRVGGEPERQADQTCAEHRPREGHAEGHLAFRVANLQGGLADCVLAEYLLPGKQHEPRQQHSADEIAQESEAAVLRQIDDIDAALEPSQGSPDASGEHLGSRQDNQHDPEREGDATDELRRAIAHL